MKDCQTRENETFGGVNNVCSKLRHENQLLRVKPALEPFGLRKVCCCAFSHIHTSLTFINPPNHQQMLMTSYLCGDSSPPAPCMGVHKKIFNFQIDKFYSRFHRLLFIPIRSRFGCTSRNIDINNTSVDENEIHLRRNFFFVAL